MSEESKAAKNPLAWKYTFWYTGAVEHKDGDDYQEQVKPLATIETVRKSNFRLKTSGQFTNIFLDQINFSRRPLITYFKKESSRFGKTTLVRKVEDGIFGYRRVIQTDFGKICF